MMAVEKMVIKVMEYDGEYDGLNKLTYAFLAS